MDREVKQFIIDCINQRRSDDLTRAKLSFQHFSSEQMKQQHGNSGQTRQQILNGYTKRDKQCDEAIAVINNS